jgi:hypothetical protein
MGDRRKQHGEEEHELQLLEVTQDPTFRERDIRRRHQVEAVIHSDPAAEKSLETTGVKVLH